MTKSPTDPLQSLTKRMYALDRACLSLLAAMLEMSSEIEDGTRRDEVLDHLREAIDALKPGSDNGGS